MGEKGNCVVPKAKLWLYQAMGVVCGAFGKAPRREADKQSIGQAGRQPVKQSVRQASRHTGGQFGFFSVADYD